MRLVRVVIIRDDEGIYIALETHKSWREGQSAK